MRADRWREWLDPKRQGAVRLLGYVNHANMGVYRDAEYEGAEGAGER